MKHIISLLFILLGTSALFAQELNCNVTIVQPQVILSDASIFKTMETTIEEFMNNRKWSKDDWAQNERIDCNLQITIESQPSQRQFKGSIQVGSSRPVYNSDYKTPLLNVNDRDFEFTFQENTLIQWSFDQHRDNLSSVLAYYANLILAMDYDSFSLEGGNEYFLICQTIVSNAQSAAEAGWKANEKGQQNRYWLVENLLSQTFKPMRECVYKYHRLGMDKMLIDMKASQKVISDAVVAMIAVHQVRPSSYNMQVFFYAKGDELVSIFKPLPKEEKQAIHDAMKKLDPGNITKYEKMMN
jgi:hypothetical protein